MDIAEYKAKTTETVIEPMLELMEEWDDEDYTEEDVRECERLIHSYLDALGAMQNPTDEDIMQEVKVLVLALNDLNEATDYSLIETGEREAIWEIIQTGAIDCGLQEASDDITEEWRDW